MSEKLQKPIVTHLFKSEPVNVIGYGDICLNEGAN